MSTSTKAALITGGGTGVGRAATVQLASRGYSRSRDEAESAAALAREQGVRAIAIGCNVAGPILLDSCDRV